MKKILIMYIVYFVIIFSIPIIFTKKDIISGERYNLDNSSDVINIINNDNKDVDIKFSNEKYNYKDYSDIKLLHTKTEEIEILSLDTYLLGVVSAEMPASFEQEAINAQAIVARTYTIYSIAHNVGKHDGADICDNPNCCQAWISKDDRLEKWDENDREENWKKIITSVETTKGKIITYKGEPIDAFFHSNSGGITEIPVNVWGGTNYPYLQTVQTAGEDAYAQYSSEVIISKDEFISKIKEKHHDFQINFSEKECIKIMEYTESNRVKTIRIGNTIFSGVELRGLIGLKSTNFEVAIEGENVIFNVKGYGHGVGMSQTGADSLAKQGMNYKDIIIHFYSGIEITDF